MPPKVRDLEIIYNIKWKNKSTNGGDKAIVLGMYDIPATTLSWAVFKTYLLKNSGTVADGEDARVFYVTDNKTEFPIDSQIDFQIALYAFRRKARMGDIVNLRLERVVENHQHAVQQNSQKNATDVETQIDNTNTTCCSSNATAPEWFLSYMRQFKKDFTDEMKNIVSDIVENRKPSIQPCNVKVKYRQQVKNARKLHAILPENTCEIKESPKLSSRAEVKLERKLEKLEQKSKMIKERKQALLKYTASKSKDIDHTYNKTKENEQTKQQAKDNDLTKKSKENESINKKSNNDIDCSNIKKNDNNILTIRCDDDSETDNDETDDVDKSMDACMTENYFVVPRFYGGETYIHYWEVKNTGTKAWDADTVLEFAWGSKALEPLDKVVEVPHLAPNQIGVVTLRLKIPKKAGNYETYWNFMHKNRRFGHWLGCHVSVNPPKTDSVQIMNDPPYDYSPILDKRYGSYVKPSLLAMQEQPEKTVLEAQMVKVFRTIATNVCETDLGLNKKKTNQLAADKKTKSYNSSSTSDSDCNSTKITAAKGDFVVVPIPECFKVERKIPKFKPQPTNLQSVVKPEKRTLYLDGNTSSSVVVEKVKLDNKTDDEDKDIVDEKENNNEKGHSLPDINQTTGAAAYYLDDPHIGNQSGDAAVLSYLNEYNSNDYPFMVLNDAKYPIAEIKSEYLTRYNNITTTTASTSSTNTQHSPKSTTNNIDEEVDVVVDAEDDIEDDDDDEDVSSSDSTNCASGSSTIEIITAKDIAQAMLEEEEVKANAAEKEQHNDNNNIDMKKVDFECVKKPQTEDEEKVVANLTTSSPVKPTMNDDNVMSESTSDAFKSMPSLEADYNSHCSAVGSCFSDENNIMMLSDRHNGTSSSTTSALRTFIFPHDLPGYEVIQSAGGVDDNTNEQWFSYDEHTKFDMEPNKPSTGPPPLNLSMHDRNPFIVASTMPNIQQPQQPTAQVDLTLDSPQQQSTAAAANIIEEQSMPTNTWKMESNITTTDINTTSTTYSTVAATVAAAALASAMNIGGSGGGNISGQMQKEEREESGTATAAANSPATAPSAPPASSNNVHILPETLVSGAVNVASSAINTARSVFGMIVPQEPGRWVNGHWVSNNPETKREANLQALAEMGFWNRDLNATLLARYNDDLSRVVGELVQ